MAKKGYWVGHIDVTNPERYKDYIAANAAPLKKYGARFTSKKKQSVFTDSVARWPWYGPNHLASEIMIQ